MQPAPECIDYEARQMALSARMDVNHLGTRMVGVENRLANVEQRLESLEQKVTDGFEDLHGLLNQVLDRLPERQEGDQPQAED